MVPAVVDGVLHSASLDRLATLFIQMRDCDPLERVAVIGMHDAGICEKRHGKPGNRSERFLCSKRRDEGFSRFGKELLCLERPSPVRRITENYGIDLLALLAEV